MKEYSESPHTGLGHELLFYNQTMNNEFEMLMHYASKFIVLVFGMYPSRFLMYHSPAIMLLLNEEYELIREVKENRLDTLHVTDQFFIFAFSYL